MLPKGKGKLINPDDLKQVFEPDKIEPLNIDDYYTRVKPLPDNRYDYVTLRTEEAIRALFAKMNEVIYKLEEKEKK